MHPALSVQRSGDKQLRDMGAGAVSSSFPVFASPLDDKYSKYPDSFQVSSGRELITNSISTNSISTQASALVSNGNIDGHLLTPPSPGFPNFSTVSPHGRLPQNSQFISQSSTDGASFPPNHSSHQDLQSPVLINQYEVSHIPWCTDTLQDLLDFPDNVPVQTGQVESATGVITSEDHTRRNDWQWADGLISELDQDWNDLPDVNVIDPISEVCTSIR